MTQKNARHMTFVNEDLSGKDFSNVDFRWSTFINCTLIGTRLKNTNLRYCLLQNLDFSTSKIDLNTDVTGAEIRNCKFPRVYKKAKGL